VTENSLEGPGLDADHERVTEPARPGEDAIEGVLASIADLDGRPVSEHVTVFEEAHDRLRDALARAGDNHRAT
jgi:hypothetical protein